MSRPARVLQGRRIVVTRAADQAEALLQRLAALGAEVLELPTIEIWPAPDYGPLDQAIRGLDEYDWLIFTSANGVRFFEQRLARAGRTLASIRQPICAIGPATRKALERRGAAVRLVPEEYVAESLVASFDELRLEGARILLPRAAVARDVVPEALRRRGASVDVIEAYRTRPPADLAERADVVFGGARKPDWITFTSSSTVANFLAAVGPEKLAGVRVASIGPVTSATARAGGLPVDAEAREYTIGGLVEAIVEAEQAPVTR
jgi:uroporphyrinogen III methyltransferase / synthase